MILALLIAKRDGLLAIERMISAGENATRLASIDSRRKQPDLFSFINGLDSGRKCLRRFTHFPLSASLQGLDGPSLVEVDDRIELV